MPKHVTLFLDEACAKVSNLNVVYAKAQMALMSKQDLTMEQRQAILAIFEPVNQAIKTANAAFTLPEEDAS